jgi:hypothetical protein
MQVQAVLLCAFGASMLIAALGAAANIYVLVVLCRLHVPISFIWTGMPTYALRLCRELPTSPENARLTRLTKWSVISFLVAMVGAGIAGPMM